jgi:hypothetical protein
MRRHLRLLVLLALLGAVIFVRAGMASDEDERGAVVPPVPAAPPDATAYEAVTEDGTRVIARHNGTWVWLRIDSAPSRNCLPRGGSIGVNYVQFGGHEVRDDGTFRLTYSYGAAAEIQRGRFRGQPVYRSVPKQVDVRVRGRVADGRITGRVWRRDRLGDGPVPELDCTRRIAFTAAPSAPAPHAER